MSEVPVTMIELLLLDADGTLWDHPDLSSLARPFKRESEGTITDRNGVVVTLRPGAKETLRELRRRGVATALVTWNRPEYVAEGLKAFGIADLFDYVRAEDSPDKHLLIARLMEELKETGRAVSPERVLYVDDRTLHLEKTREVVGPVRFLQFGVDVKRFEEILLLD